jgi:hypothetical protein
MKGIGDGVWKPDNSGLATKSGSTNTGITGALHQPEWVVPTGSQHAGFLQATA